MLVFALAFGALTLTRFHGPVASVWLANAVVVGVVIGAPRREWPRLAVDRLRRPCGRQSRQPRARCCVAAVLALVSIIESAIVLYPDEARVRRPGAVRRRLCHCPLPALRGRRGAARAPRCLRRDRWRCSAGADFATTLRNWYIADALGLLTLGALFLAVQANAGSPPRRAARRELGRNRPVERRDADCLTGGSEALLFAVAPVLMIATLRAPLAGDDGGVDGLCDDRHCRDRKSASGRSPARTSIRRCGFTCSRGLSRPCCSSSFRSAR